ncbi:MAG: hypothetical protein IT373_19030 [Polyangiaceae bacterium]|nr:hypothetical protein [Polyangiaceae bacterium]
MALPRSARVVAWLGAAAGLVLACSPDALPSRPDPNATAAPACTPAGTPCALVFSYPLTGAHTVELRGDFAANGWQTGVPMQVDGGRWRVELQLPDGQAVRYKFLVDGTQWVNDPANPETEPDGVGGVNSVKTASCAYVPCPVTGTGGSGGAAPGVFDWRSAVMYFVFVDRFFNGDVGNDATVAGVEPPANYQGGDYAGVIAKLEDGYFESLGVNALWLTVPMNNPNVAGAGSDGHAYSAYHGYWPTDLDQSEEHFGSKALLATLVDTAHARGIKVLLDYAMNHVHSAAPIYQQHPEWFWPLQYNGNNCVCGDGCDWNDSYQQKRCWFRDYLPDWNFTVPEARAYSVGNAIQWVVDTGADGFRLDAVKHIELDWILDLRARVRDEIEPVSGQHFYMVGETFESGNRDVLKFYVGSDRLDGQFDFPLRGNVVERILRRSGTMYDLDAFLATNDGYYGGVMSTFIGNHDLARVVNTALDQPWGAWDNGGSSAWDNPPGLPANAAPFERLAVAYTFLFTTKGIPLVYYGDEVAMPGAGDPDNRRFMQWDGLSQSQLLLRDHMARLGAIRRDHPALWRGWRSTLSVSNDTYAYSMSDGIETVYVGLNRGDNPGAVGGMPAVGRDLLTGAKLEGPNVNLGPRSSVVVVAE